MSKINGISIDENHAPRPHIRKGRVAVGRIEFSTGENFLEKMLLAHWNSRCESAFFCFEYSPTNIQFDYFVVPVQVKFAYFFENFSYFKKEQKETHLSFNLWLTCFWKNVG